MMKKIAGKYSLYQLLLFTLILFGFGLSAKNNETQKRFKTPVKAYFSHLDSLRYDSLLANYGKHKILPQNFEIQALVALSHYPELKNEQIEFRFKKAKSAHAARPDFWSVFKPKNKRKYIVIISPEVKEHLEYSRLEHLNYNAQIGVLGHELAHIADYSQRNFCGILGFGIRYTRNKTIAEIETATDMRAVEHGLGYQLLAWSESVHKMLEADGRGERYLKPNQIRKVLSEHHLYN